MTATSNQILQPADHLVMPAVKQEIERVQTVLFQIKSVFPFDLFPDTITVYPTKVTVVKKYFFASQEVRALMIEDIAEIDIQTGLLFSKILIVSRLSPALRQVENKQLIKID